MYMYMQYTFSYLVMASQPFTSSLIASRLVEGTREEISFKNIGIK